MSELCNWIAKPLDEKRTIAYSNLEVRAEGNGNTLVGYAALFDSPSEPMPFIEYVKRGAFSKTLNDGADVRLLINHEGVPLARSKSGTLALEEDERGLRVEADLDPSKLLTLPIRAFKFKSDYLDATDNRSGMVVPGLIAEEVAEHYPIAADRGNDGLVENWNERFVIPGMLALIQDLHARVETLEGGTNG